MASDLPPPASMEADQAGGQKDKKKKEKKKKREKGMKKSTSLLSFGGDEEEGEVFVVKKKKKGKSAVDELQEKRRRSRAKAEAREGKGSDPTLGGGGRDVLMGSAYASSTRGLYSQEEMDKLKGNAIHVNTGTGKAGSVRGGNTLDDEAADVAAMEDEEGEGNAPAPSPSEALMPSHRDVQAARRKREQLRSMGDSYITLNSKDGGNGALRKLPEQGDVIMGREFGRMEGESTLARENEDDDEEDITEDRGQSRLQFPGDSSKDQFGRYGAKLIRGKARSKSGRRRVDEVENAGADAAEDDEELQQWEMEQIRKGLGKAAEKPRGARANPLQQLQQQQQQQQRPGAWTAPKPTSLVDVASFCKEMRASLDRRKEEHAGKNRNLNAIKAELARSDSRVKDLEAKVEGANSQYLFYQSVRDQVADILDCLNEKAGMIEEASEEMREIKGSRARARADKRRRRLEDLQALAFPEQEAVKQEEQEPELDEFGRDISFQASKGRDARLAAYRQRKAARITRRGQQPEPDGWSSDEEDGLGENFEEQRLLLLDDASHIFDDAESHFASFHAVTNVLGTWKRLYKQAYNDAYIALSVPALVAPYVRMEIMGWQPLQTPSYDKFSWYSELFSYGIDDSSPEDDPDHNLIPTLVEKVVVPVLIDSLGWEWSPISGTQLPSVQAAVQEALAHMPPTCRGAIELAEAVLKRLRQAVNRHTKAKLVPLPEMIAAQQARLLAACAAPAPVKKEPSRKHSRGGIGLVKQEEDLGEQAGGPEAECWGFCRALWWRALKLLTHIAAFRAVGGVDDSALRDLCVSHVGDNVLPLVAVEASLLLKSPFSAEQRERVGEMLAQLLKALPQEWADQDPDGALGQLVVLLQLHSNAAAKKQLTVQQQALTKMLELIQ